MKIDEGSCGDHVEPTAPGAGGSNESALREFAISSSRRSTFTTPARLKDDTSLLEAGIVDSTGVLEVIQFLEATFGFHVEDDEIVPANLDTVEHLVGFVSRKTGTGAP